MKLPGVTQVRSGFNYIEVVKYHPYRRIDKERLRIENRGHVTEVEVTTTAIYDLNRGIFRFQTLVFPLVVGGTRYRLSGIEIVETTDEEIAKQNHLRLCRKYSREEVGEEELWEHRYNIVEWTQLGLSAGYKEPQAAFQGAYPHATVCISDFLDMQREST